VRPSIFNFIKLKLPKGKNNKRILKNVIYSLLLKGGGLATSLLLLPAYLKFFEDKTILGFWFTAISVLSWILNFDIGVGNGLRNHLVGCFAKNDNENAKKYISSAYGIFFIIISLIFVIGFFLIDYLDWNRIFNIEHDFMKNSSLIIIVKIVFSSICLQFFLRIIFSISYAMQNSYLPNLISLSSGILQYLFIIFATPADIESNLLYVSIVNIISVNGPLIIMTVLIFSTKLKKCRPDYKYIRRKYSSDILKLGGTFFWIQIMYMLIHNTSNFFISWLDDPSSVVEYQIYFRISSLVGTLIHLAMTPIWSEVTEAHKLGNFQWIDKLFRKLMLFILISILLQIGLVPFYQVIFNTWLGKNTIEVNYLFAITFALSGIVFIWNNVISTIINGLGMLKLQFYFFTVGGIINFPLAILFFHLSNSWISIVVANIFALLPYCVVQTIWLRKYLLKRQRITNEVNESLN